MSYKRSFIRRLRTDQKGASLVEYSVLVGIVLVLGITSIRGVGAWMNVQWTDLNTNLSAN
jgi:pilus assembly protein Flp/PilA